jgi:hypothetical protein
MQSLKFNDFQKHVSRIQTESLWKTVLLSKLEKVHNECNNKNIQVTNKSGVIITQNRNPKVSAALEDIRRCMDHIGLAPSSSHSGNKLGKLKASQVAILPQEATQAAPIVPQTEQLHTDKLVGISDSLTSIQTQLVQLQSTQKRLSEQCLLDKKSLHSGNKLGKLKASQVAILPQEAAQAASIVPQTEQLHTDKLVGICDSLTSIQAQLVQLQSTQKRLSEQCLLDKKSFHHWTSKQLEPALQIIHTDVKNMGLLHNDAVKADASLATMGKVDDVTSVTREMLVARANDIKSQLDAMQVNDNRSLQQEIKHRRRGLNNILKDHEMASESELLELGNQLCDIGDLSDLHVSNAPSSQKFDSEDLMLSLQRIKNLNLSSTQRKCAS